MVVLYHCKPISIKQFTAIPMDRGTLPSVLSIMFQCLKYLRIWLLLGELDLKNKWHHTKRRFVGLDTAFLYVTQHSSQHMLVIDLTAFTQRRDNNLFLNSAFLNMFTERACMFPFVHVASFIARRRWTTPTISTSLGLLCLRTLLRN